MPGRGAAGRGAAGRNKKTSIADIMFEKVEVKHRGATTIKCKCILCLALLVVRESIGNLTSHFRVCPGNPETGYEQLKNIDAKETYLWKQYDYFCAPGETCTRPELEEIELFFKPFWEELEKEEKEIELEPETPEEIRKEISRLENAMQSMQLESTMKIRRLEEKLEVAERRQPVVAMQEPVVAIQEPDSGLPSRENSEEPEVANESQRRFFRFIPL
ncbi:unnamed protein product [Orchesella dallaii]|uniref:Uncharacterized protein n=1 Tax=Orchesella dallaii TaxID=48710 RepID=A0ABP1RST6_9HEXA